MFKTHSWQVLTLSLHISWTLFLCKMRIIPGGCSQASPSTWTGTPSSPKIRITIERHWAIRCLCKFIIRDAPMCIEPKTATTWKTNNNISTLLFYTHTISSGIWYDMKLQKLPPGSHHRNLMVKIFHPLLRFPKN